MTYNWRESLQFQVSRLKRHMRADLAEWASRQGARLSSGDWIWAEERVDRFLEEYQELTRGAATETDYVEGLQPK